MSSSEAHLSTLTLHRLRYGELRDPERARARAHLDRCEACRARLAVQERERERFVAAPVPPALREAAARRPVRVRGWALVAALAVAASTLLWTASASGPALPDAPAPEVRTRGTLPDLELWVDVGSGPRRLRRGEALGEGDRVQLKIRPDRAEHLAVAGRDSSGQIEIYGAFSVGGRSGLIDMPFALALDDAPGTQEFFVVGGAEPLEAATIREAVRAWPRSHPEVEVRRRAVEKEAPAP